jgi:hemolysin activation/secretion protein
MSYDNADRYDGVNQALVEYSFGLSGWGSGDNNSALKSRVDGKYNYQKLALNLSRSQELGYFSPAWSQFSINAALMGQYSATGLLSTEECGIGGSRFGRAYDFSEILGDSCLAGSLELRYAINTQGSPFQYTQLYAFYDGGKTYNENPLNATDQKTKSLSSAGLGVRFGVWKYLSGSLEVTKPLTRDVANEGDKNSRLFANISARF